MYFKNAVILTSLFALILTSVYGQKKDKISTKKKASNEQEFLVSCIGFYNLENLFDTIDSPNVRDTEYTPEGSKGWTGKRYQHKLQNLSHVISQLGTEITPDGVAVLGVSEIENKTVLEELVATDLLKARNYEIVHYNSPDKRGIDVAFLYQPKYFKLSSSKAYEFKLENDTSFYTRDQLLVSGELNGERTHFIVAHWPSRRGGEKRSRPKRNAAADLARSIIDSIQNVEENARIILMGDLNDDPTNESVKKHINTSGNKEKIEANQLYNPMEKLYKQGIGTLAWRDVWNLFDQIIITPSMVGNDPSDSYQYYGTKVFNKTFLKQTEGRYQGYPKRSFAGGTYLGGYSYHFPVFIYLIKNK